MGIRERQIVRPDLTKSSFVHPAESDIWQQRAAGSKERKAALQRELGNIERSVNQIIDRIAATSEPGLIAVYEKRVSELQRDKVALAEKAQSSDYSLPDFDGTLRTALQFLASLWNSGKLNGSKIAERY
jgi:hypothetical protein